MSSAGLNLPHESIELPFLEYWSSTLLDPRDPQNPRWLELELGQVARNRRIAGEIGAHVPMAGARVLDVGCQTGALSVAMSERGAHVTGIDVDAPLVHGAAIRARCYGIDGEFVAGVAEALPFDEETFDLVTLIDVLEHVRDIVATLDECVRVLRPGGALYLQGPNRWSPRWFLRDPHYEMLGISVLPPSLGRFYVTRVRGRPRYDVGVFPVGARVVQQLVARGCDVVVEPNDVRARSLPRLHRWWTLHSASLFTVVARVRP